MKRILFILTSLITLNSSATDCQQLITTAKNYVDTYIVPNGNNTITGTRANAAFNYIITALKCVDTIQDLSFTRNGSRDSFVIVYKGVRFAVKDSIGSGGSGTVTSIATDLTLTGGTITTTGTLKVDTSVISTLSALKDSIDNLRNVSVVTDTTLYTVINSLNTPPVSPNTGDVYLVGNSPTGAWVGHSKDIATWDGSAWTFIDGVQGNFLYNTTNLLTYIYRSGNWVQTGGIPALNNGNTISSGLTIGTNNLRSLEFETNNSKRGRFDSVGLFHVYNLPISTDTFVNVTDINGKFGKIGKQSFLSGYVSNQDTQSLYIRYSDSIRLGITRGNYISFAYAYDSINMIANGDSLLTIKGSVRRTVSTGDMSFTKNASRDSIILTYHNVRYAVKDSVGSGSGSSWWSLTGNSATDSTTNFVGTTDARPLNFYTNNVLRAKIDRIGRFGVGILNPISSLHAVVPVASSVANGLTLQPLTSNARLNVSFDVTYDSATYLGFNSYFNNSAVWTAAQATGSYIKANATGLLISTSNGNTINSAYTNSASTKSIMLFASNGNVTVGGTTDWGYRLNVNCSTAGFDGQLIQNSSSSGSARTGIMLYNGNANLGSLIYKAGASFTTVADRNALFIENTEASPIVLSSTNASGSIVFRQLTGTERMRIGTNGGVNIGGAADNNASSLLELNSTTKGFRLMNMTATQASAITKVDGLMVYVTTTDATFTSIGFWGVENNVWVKL